MSTHYSCAMEPGLLASFADKASDNLLKLLNEDNVDIGNVVLAYRGMSGTALATALALELYTKTETEVGMIFVRKEEDDTHGYSIERSDNALKRGNVYVFVDDFISSGETLEAVISALSDAYLIERVNYIVLQKSDLCPVNPTDSAGLVLNLAARIPYHWDEGIIQEVYSVDKADTRNNLKEHHESESSEPSPVNNHSGNCYFDA